MVVECCVPTCSYKRNSVTKAQGITFHSFPKEKNLRMSWRSKVRRLEKWVPKDWDVVCSVHFRPEDFDRTGQTVRLRQNVVPSIFPNLPKHLQKKADKPRLTATSRVTPLQELPPRIKKRRVVKDQSNMHIKQIQQEHSYCCPAYPLLKKKWEVAQKRIEILESKLHRLRQRRSKKAMKSVVAELKAKNLLSADCMCEYFVLYNV